MDCPHPDIQCEDCTEYPCVRLAALPLPHTDCARCPLARLVADFQRRLSEEQAYMTGDAARDEWTALHGGRP